MDWPSVPGNPWWRPYQHLLPGCRRPFSCRHREHGGSSAECLYTLSSEPNETQEKKENVPVQLHRPVFLTHTPSPKILLFPVTSISYHQFHLLIYMTTVQFLASDARLCAGEALGSLMMIWSCFMEKHQGLILPRYFIPNPGGYDLATELSTSRWAKHGSRSTQRRL